MCWCFSSQKLFNQHNKQNTFETLGTMIIDDYCCFCHNFPKVEVLLSVHCLVSTHFISIYSNVVMWIWFECLNVLFCAFIVFRESVHIFYVAHSYILHIKWKEELNCFVLFCHCFWIILKLLIFSSPFQLIFYFATICPFAIIFLLFFVLIHSIQYTIHSCIHAFNIKKNENWT